MATQLSTQMNGTPPTTHSIKAGPTSSDWNRHKDFIVKLYKSHTLKHVMRVMEDRHDFRASKRQYDRKFELWEVSKNLKVVEKERILNIVAESGTWTFDSASMSPKKCRQTIRPIEPDHYRKAMRHLKAQKRRTSSASQPAPKHRHSSTPSLGSLSPSTDYEKFTTESATPWMMLTAEPTSISLCGRHTSDQVSLRVLETSPYLNNTTTMPCSQSEETWSWIDEESPDCENVITSSPSDQVQVGGTGTYSPCGLFTLSHPIPLVPDGTCQVNIEKLLKGLYICVSNITDPATCITTLENCSPQSSAGSRFWYEVANGIYLLKVQSNLAYAALNKASRLVDAALSDAQSLTVKFIREFFLTLSPGNTKINPFVRKMLLQLLQSRASTILGPQHHFTVISTELLKDDDEQEVSELGLRCCVDAIYSNRGLNDSSGLAIQVECAIIRSHRHNGDLELAAAESLSLYRKTTRRLQQHRNLVGMTSEDMQGYQTHLRLAATELAHVRMAQRGDHYDEAIRMSLVSLTGRESTSQVRETWPPTPSSVPGQFEDKAAVHTMEDLAKICHELGLVYQAIEWLTPAEELAIRVIGPIEQEIATAHISQKLLELHMELDGADD